MLDVALQFLANELNAYLVSRTGSLSSDVVNLNQIVGEDNKYVMDDESIALTLINIEEERTLRSQLPTFTYKNDQHSVSEPELKLNLQILFVAKFAIYDQSLKWLSLLLTYFQSHPSFTSDAYPGLDPRIEKLTVELQSPGYEQLNQIWAFLGAKHLPSVVYKVRMVILQDDGQRGVQPPLSKISTETHAL
jgi:hypothetical protein